MPNPVLSPYGSRQLDVDEASPTQQESRVNEALARLLPPLEQQLIQFIPTPIVHAAVEFLVFGIKQAWACLLGGLILAALIFTGLFWPEHASIARYDALLIYAIGLQIVFIMTKLERPKEALVILIFHSVGLFMEIFKTHMGSWTYPEANIFRLGGVPLFSGFMYASVGSYLARVARTHEFSFNRYPRRHWTLMLAVLIYMNFFTHHFGPDIRLGLFAFAGVLYWRTWVSFSVWRWRHRMPLLLGFFLVSLFIWIAENVGTLSGSWLYPDQLTGWRPVSFSKMGSWYLLMIISWVLVTLVHPPRLEAKAPPVNK
ncbi:MAG: DUF817 domain-containing protein [Pseudomonadota bacterium]